MNFHALAPEKYIYIDKKVNVIIPGAYFKFWISGWALNRGALIEICIISF